MSHTKGPWTVTSCDEHFGEYRIAEAALEQDRAETDDEKERSQNNDKGNARLIAAAPCLLAACEALLEAFATYAQRTVDLEGEDALHSSVKSARAAINKTKGQQ